MAPPPVPDTLPCETGAVFAREVKDAKDILALEETEESWEKIARAIARMHALYNGGGFQFEADVVPALKTVVRPIVNAMNSERSRLSFVAIDFVASLSSLGRAFEPLLHFLFDALLKLCTRTSKVLVARSEAAIMRIVEETTLPGLLPHLREAVKDKSQTLRTAASTAVLMALQTFAPRDLANKISDVEEIIKSTGRDANPAVRQTSRKIFEAYQILFPDRIDAFTAPLSPTTKKYLAIKPRPVATSHSAHAPPPTSAPSTSMSTAFPTSSNHARSASASDHPRREQAPPPPLRAQRSRAALRAGADMPPPAAPPAQHHTEFQPARSAPAPGAQRTRTVSTVSAKSVHAALSAATLPPTTDATTERQERQKVGPQRVLLAERPLSLHDAPQRILADQPARPLSLHDAHPHALERIPSGPSRVQRENLTQRPASALGTVSVTGAVTLSSSSNDAPTQAPPVQTPVHVHRAQRVLAPVPPPPPPPAPPQKEKEQMKEKEHRAERAPSRAERAPSRADRERAPSRADRGAERAPSRAGAQRAPSAHGSGGSNPSSRPPSAASMASRTTKTSKPTTTTTASRTRTISTTSKPPTTTVSGTRTRTISTTSKSAPTTSKPAPTTTTHSRPPISKSAASNKPAHPPTTGSGFVPKRNNGAGGGGATGMTAAALSRAKELREARDQRSHAAPSKPTWGGGSNTKNTKDKNAKVAAVLARKAAKKAVEVPLPPSPGAPPREVPLPESPVSSPVAVWEEAEVEELHLNARTEELHLDAHDDEKENIPEKVGMEKVNGNLSVHDLVAQVDELERMVLGQVNTTVNAQ